MVEAPYPLKPWNPLEPADNDEHVPEFDWEEEDEDEDWS